MREIHKEYATDGLIQNINDMEASILPMKVHLTRDKRGCTVSIELEGQGLLFTVPFDEPLKDLDV